MSEGSDRDNVIRVGFGADGKLTRAPSPEPAPFPDFEGRGFWGYNKNPRQYEGFWIDTASTIMQTEFGEVDESGGSGFEDRVGGGVPQRLPGRLLEPLLRPPLEQTIEFGC